MKIVSDQTFGAFQDKGLAQLRQKILERWHKNQNEAANEAGQDGREEILADIESLSREDPSLTETNLMLLADLKLVEVSNQRRATSQAD